MATTFKHFKPYDAPWSAHMFRGFSVTPTVEAIIVDRVPIVNPQLASIIGNNAKSVVPCPEDSHATSPSYSEMIAPGKT
jgi:hypothetical protein